MPMTFTRFIALVLVVALAACSQPPRGSLDVTIVGVPEATPSVVVTGPGGFTRMLSESTALEGLAVGTYTVTPTALEVANEAFAGVERFGAAVSSIGVVASETAMVDVAYAYEGFTLSDPEGDALGVSLDQPIYDVTEVRSHVDGDTLVLRLTMAEGQDDLANLFGFLQIDADRDATTGFAFEGEEYCGAYASFGGEFSIATEGGEAGLFTGVGGALIEVLVMTIVENTVTFEVPLALIGGEARVHVATVIGNTFEPTDCVPFGVVVFVP
jgi:hypothetical protein